MCIKDYLAQKNMVEYRYGYEMDRNREVLLSYVFPYTKTTNCVNVSTETAPNCHTAAPKT